MLLELQSAQGLFEQLPPRLQLPSLNPLYCAADARRDAQLSPRFLCFQADGALLLHSIHEAPVPGGGTDWQSPYGYGGPIGFGLSAPVLATAWALFDAHARERGVIAEFVRFHPLADNFRLYPGTVHEDRSVVSIDLGAPDLESSYSARARNTLRKARHAGLAARWEDPQHFGYEFAALYRSSMQRVGASEFYRFGADYFRSLVRLPFMRMLAVRQAEQLVAAAIFLWGPEVVEYHLSGSTPDGRTLGATNLLLHEAACTAQREGRTALYLGGGTDSRRDNPLLRFKESFAPARNLFRFGARVLDPQAYARLRERFPEQSRHSQRVLFYRGN